MEATKVRLSLLGRLFKIGIKGLKLTEIQRNYFDLSEKVKLSKLEIWPGYFSSINLYKNNAIFLNIDQAFKIIRTQNFLDHYYKEYNDFETFRNDVIGTTVMTSYNQRMYRIDDLTFKVTVTHSF